MRYIIDEARGGRGWAVYSQPEEYEPNRLEAAASTLDEALSFFSGSRSGFPLHQTLDEWARAIAACNNPINPAPKISMIKLLRSITGCGLKEGKEAIERYC